MFFANKNEMAQRRIDDVLFFDEEEIGLTYIAIGSFVKRLESCDQQMPAILNKISQPNFKTKIILFDPSFQNQLPLCLQTAGCANWEHQKLINGTLSTSKKFKIYALSDLTIRIENISASQFSLVHMNWMKNQRYCLFWKSTSWVCAILFLLEFSQCR